MELNLDSNPVEGRPYILNPRITIVGPLGVLKIIRQLGEFILYNVQQLLLLFTIAMVTTTIHFLLDKEIL